VEEHFAGTHLNAEQFAIAAYRNLRMNPVAALLLPHLKEASLINHQANRVLISQDDGYIPKATALTEKGLHQRTRDILGFQDWKGWKPMEAISDAHTYAKAEQLFWEVTGQYVEAVFKNREAMIKKHWYEIFRFSEDLVNHAVPVAFSAPQDAPPAMWQSLKKRRYDYYCGQYRFDPDIERPQVGGVTRALSRITKASSFDAAAPEDWQNLKDACRYAIMTATFMHTWINEHQYDDIGEVLYSSLGLRYGDKKDGIMAPEDDYGIAPDLKISTGMLWFSNFLSRTEYGFITREPVHDVNPIFSQLLEAKRAEFGKFGVDIDAIECSTNI
jgi:Lipoxygenase